MRLLVDAHVFDGKYQGTRTYLEGLYKNAHKHKDIDFYFAAQDLNNLRCCFGEAENLHYVKLCHDSAIWRLAIGFPRIIKEHNIDWAHFQYIVPLQKRCKEIVTTHDILFMDFPHFFPLSYRLKNGFFFKRSSKRADLQLTVSEYSKSRLCHHFGLDHEKVFVTPNGVTMFDEVVDTDILKRLDLNKYIMTVGRIEPRKNHLMLLKAFVELKLYERGYKLVMVGSPDLKAREFNDYHENLSAEIKEKVLMFVAGYKDLLTLYKNASLFVFPSYGEGFGIPPIEASALGCPVLCSNATAMKDFDFYGECLYNPYDLNEMKNKMAAILEGRLNSDYDFKKIYTQRYDWNMISENFIKLLRQHISTKQ